MELLRYNELYVSREIRDQFDRVVEQLVRGDFRSAEVKKLKPTTFYRAKLNESDRLLFKFARHGDTRHLLLLEVIYNHAYDKSRFLKGAAIDENKLEPLTEAPSPTAHEVEPLAYANPKTRQFCFLDKILSFDDVQNSVLHMRPPVILIGSAGSGKTVLTLEKLKYLHGDILYVTHSPFLVENARNLYYASNYDNEKQNIEFLSFRELLESVRIPPGREVTWRAFADWFNRHRASVPVKDAHKLYEEFKGVITGSVVDRPYLSAEQYLALGVRQSIFLESERAVVYELFNRYLRFLHEEQLYDLNIACFETLPLSTPGYDFVVVDEVQDLTLIQIQFILKRLRVDQNFVFCGDSNQIVHPNFFSWATVKSFFYEKGGRDKLEIMRVLNTNYRNSPEVTAYSNRLLLLKNLRFGSIDRESNYLVQCNAAGQGRVEFLRDIPAVRQELNQKTRKSANFAVIVMRDEDKTAAAKYFETPLIFAIHEAKGLEYPNIILYNFVSGDAKPFAEIAAGVTATDLQADSVAYNRARDKSDKSLEVYKFFVNSLYVAMTRAVRSLYVIESHQQHPLLDVLGMIAPGEKVNVANQESSRDEWNREARRLELQGKQEQADAIRRRILGNTPVPWQVVSRDRLDWLRKEALNPEVFNNQAKHLLFEYACVYNLPRVFGELLALKYNRARFARAELPAVIEKHTRLYNDRSGKFNDLYRLIEKHGVDYRNPLNQTPLMLAASLGLAPLVKRLLADGASRETHDNGGRTALQLALAAAFAPTAKAEDYTRGPFAGIYADLAPSCIRVRVFNRLVKIDARNMEFFLLNCLIAQFVDLVQDVGTLAARFVKFGFTAADLTNDFARIPDTILPEYRKRQTYISSILAKNEIRSSSPYSRRLLLRAQRGQYILNPAIELELDGKFVNVCDLLGIDELAKAQESSTAKHLLQYITLTRLKLTQKEQMPARQRRPRVAQSPSAPTPDAPAPAEVGSGPAA